MFRPGWKGESFQGADQESIFFFLPSGLLLIVHVPVPLFPCSPVPLSTCPAVHPAPPVTLVEAATTRQAGQGLASASPAATSSRSLLY